MLKDLGVATLKDFIGLLKNENQFFSLDESARREKISHYLGDYPSFFVDYLVKLTAEDFLKDIKHALDVFEKAAYADPKNQFLTVLAQYITQDFAHQFDQLDINFFFVDSTERFKRLKSLFPGETALSEAATDLVLNSTYQEMGILANASLSYLKDSPFIVIQTPVELEPELRRNIRSYIVEKYPFSFPEFQVNPGIIGGLRVFVGGKVIDHSWMGKIQALANLAELSK